MRTVRALLIDGLFSSRTWSRLLYQAIGMVIGLAATIVVITGLATGFGLIILVVGLPLLWGTMYVNLLVARFDARLGRTLMDPAIPQPGSVPTLQQTSMLRSMWSFAISGRAWRALVWHVERAMVGTLVVSIVGAIPMAAYGLVVQSGWGVLYDAAVWVRVLAILAALALIALIPYVVDGFSHLLVTSSRTLLGESAREQLAAETERTTTAEARVDLARDLHDSVGHSVTAAVLQASAARAKLATDPAFADQALAAIEDQGRAALEELDRVLATMRDEGAASRSTQDLRSIDELVATARTAGQPVTLTQSGDGGAVPTPISREGFRVLQEAITNAMRHAVGAPTTVSVAAETTRLAITVVNEHGEDVDPQRSSGGRGLAGIAERVRILGGTVTSGPTPDGGFRVHAELPYDGVNG